jgi:hypothetical protein
MHRPLIRRYVGALFPHIWKLAQLVLISGGGKRWNYLLAKLKKIEKWKLFDGSFTLHGFPSESDDLENSIPVVGVSST